MKKISKMVAMLTAVMLACVLPFAGLKLTAEADGPVTYVIQYDADENDYRYEVGSQWDDNGFSRELYYLQQSIRDGDLVVIYGRGGETLKLTLNARLGNLTIVDGSAIITTNGIENCYVLNDSLCVVNGDVVNAYAYADSVSNYNDSVTNLEVVGVDVNLKATVVVMGTVDYVKAYDTQTTHFTLYNVKEGALSIEKGALTTDESKYSTTPLAPAPETTPAPAPETTPAPAPVTTPAPEPETTPAPAPQTPPASSGEYDDVPKTGDVDLSVWMFGLAAVCCLGGYALRRSGV